MVGCGVGFVNLYVHTKKLLRRERAHRPPAGPLLGTAVPGAQRTPRRARLPRCPAAAAAPGARPVPCRSDGRAFEASSGLFLSCSKIVGTFHDSKSEGFEELCTSNRMTKLLLLLVMKPWLRARYAQKHGAPSRPHPPLFCLDKRLFSLAWHRRTCCRAPWRWHTRGGGRGPPASTRGWGSAPPRHATCRQDVQVQRASGVRRRRQRRRRVAALAPLG